MLKHTFIHIDGIGTKTEQTLWKQNILTHQDVIRGNYLKLHKLDKVKETKEKLKEGDALYFHKQLPSKERWRMFSEFHNSTAYLDIETTGLYSHDDIITTIALYDGETIKYYVHGENLDDFKKDITQYKLLVTYNGTNFDLPFIKNFLNISMDYAHIDLRYILASLGYFGGLKGCEITLGLTRDESMSGMDGSFAVWLWKYYRKHQKVEALHTLLSYNIQDVLSLEKLMIFAYNKKVSEFNLSTKIFTQKIQPDNPFIVKKELVTEIQEGIKKYGSSYLTENKKIQTNEPSIKEKIIQRDGDDIYMITELKFFDKFFKDNSDKRNIPSKAKTPWVIVKSTNDYYPDTIPKKGGKWLIFIPEDKIDSVWQKVRKAILKNELVKYAKCSTISKNKYHKENRRDCVICIYTYNYDDEVDVRIVRYKLKKLGFRNKLYYKTDISTLEGRYSGKGNKKTWLYSE